MILIELYQILFIASIIFIIYIFCDLIIKIISRFRFDKETRFVLNKFEKIALWISLTILFSYIIK